jgi:hypothetical protein
LIAGNAAIKLDAGVSDGAALEKFAKELWNERVWRKALEILHDNRTTFTHLANKLNRSEKLRNNKLRGLLAQVRKAA